MQTVKVKDVIIEYDIGGLEAVSMLLHQNSVDPSTWAGQLKKEIDDKNFVTAIAKIELLSYKLLKIKEDDESGEPRE